MRTWMQLILSLIQAIGNNVLSHIGHFLWKNIENGDVSYVIRIWMCCDVFINTGVIVVENCSVALGNTFIFLDTYNYLP